MGKDFWSTLKKTYHFFSSLLFGGKMIKEIKQELRKLHSIYDQFKISNEYRGWNWDRQPLKPRYYNVNLGVSEVAYYSCCPKEAISARLGEKQLTQAMLIGLALHEVFKATSDDILKNVSNKKAPWEIANKLLSSAENKIRNILLNYKDNVVLSYANSLSQLYKAIVIEMVGDITSSYMNSGSLISNLWLSEYQIDGSPLGLSKRLRADAIMNNIVVEIKLGNKYARWHEVQLAGYSLALESQNETPYDFGIIISVNLNPLLINVKGVYIDDSLRQEFIESRDNMAEELIQEKETFNGGDGL